MRIAPRLLASGNYALTVPHGRCERVTEIVSPEDLEALYEIAAEAANERHWEERYTF
jgi:hypothetical protein